MRIAVICTVGQLARLLCFLICLPVLFSCNIRSREESAVIPPLSSPLSRDYIGFGVITSSFTHITAEPSEGSISIGYLRRGSLVRIVMRQRVRTPGGFVSWVYTDGGDQGSGVTAGWLREDVMVIYNNESQAKTASETMF